MTDVQAAYQVDPTPEAKRGGARVELEEIEFPKGAVVLCPQCSQPLKNHAYMGPGMTACVSAQCPWRSCYHCLTTYDMRTYRRVQIERPPVGIDYASSRKIPGRPDPDR